MSLFYYYLNSNGIIQGPFNLKYFKENHINAHTWVWHDGLPQWVEAGTIPSLYRFISNSEPISFSTVEEDLDYSIERFRIPGIDMGEKSDFDVLASRPPKNWIFESILVTLLCTLPFGIIALIYASRVNVFWKKGLYAESVWSSLKARFWVRISFIFALISWIITMFILLFFTPGENGLSLYNNYFYL